MSISSTKSSKCSIGGAGLSCIPVPTKLFQEGKGRLINHLYLHVQSVLQEFWKGSIHDMTMEESHFVRLCFEWRSTQVWMCTAGLNTVTLNILRCRLAVELPLGSNATSLPWL